MRNKGAIRLLAIVLALVSLYQLSFTFVTTRIEKKANEFAQGDPKLKLYYKDSVAGEPVYNFLGLRKFTYRECQEREFNLGLDLKGGMNVTLEVKVDDLVRALANQSTDTTFNRAMVLARQRQVSSQEDYVTLFGQAFAEIDPNARLAAIFNTIELRERINYNSTNEEVLDVLREETGIAITNSVKILRTRIDQFGVAQPNFQELGTPGRVLIELPGINDPDRVRKLLQVAAKLEFWETYENSELAQFFMDANARLKEINELGTTLTEDQDAEAQAVTTDDTLEPIQETEPADTTTSLLDQIEKDSTTIDEAGSIEEFNKNFPLFALLRPAADQNNYFPGSQVGFAHFRDTSRVNTILAMPQIRAIFPSNVKFHWEARPVESSRETFALHAIKVTSREGNAALDGAVVQRARQDYDMLGRPEVTLMMDAEGARVWQRLTKESVGRSIAIVLDNHVRSSPTVQGEISGGRSSISGGGMTIEEAQDLANILNVGKMDAPAVIMGENVVGPSLGQESINAGLISFLLAFMMVLIYMMFYYNRAGFVANMALLLNVFFIMGVLASLGAVLTLPGIAGIVLTLGMAVDANVIIFERIREEIRVGKGIKLAIKDGYKNALSAIIDGNVTTLLTGMILYLFGTGPIKGFATTLVIGIFTSLFTAILITRLIFERWLEKDRTINFGNKLTNDILKNASYTFLEHRKIFYYISGTVIILALVSLSFRGLNLGVDFSGGRTYVVKFEQPINTQDLAQSLAGPFNTLPEVKTFGARNEVKITTKYMIDSDDPEADQRVEEALYEGCKGFLPDGTDMDTFLSDQYRQSSQLVGPTIAADIIRGAIFSVFFALIIIFLYILIRFRNWQYGLGAVTALFHDVIIVLGIYSVFFSIMPFSLEIDQAFIAAILTIVGYSINDTVIVFDRIREYIGLYRKRERILIMNQAINSTLGRTLNTAGTTLVVLLSIFIFGGASIRGFVFAMMLGVIIGTYSSIFVASPIVYDLTRKKASAEAGTAKG